MARINVTQPFLPPLAEYEAYLRRVWESHYLTNQGPLLQEFEHQAAAYLGLPKLHLVANGTLALQVALRALDITGGEIITTPFSFVATTSAILWERCTPVFVDIEPDTFCIDAGKIEAAITPNTQAILAVHVYGYPCAIDLIEEIARRHGLHVIYDAAHAFGAKYRGQSLLGFGDVSTCSFQATKVFHTVEGGAVIARDPAVNDRVELIKKFGFVGDDHLTLGINAKASEVHAAMGLCNLKYVGDIIARRRNIAQFYDQALSGRLATPPSVPEHEPNYCYYPVVFETEAELLAAKSRLEAQDIYPRRYFYPSLNQIPYVGSSASCPVSERIARTVLCLPIYDQLALADAKRIAQAVLA